MATIDDCAIDCTLELRSKDTANGKQTQLGVKLFDPLVASVNKTWVQHTMYLGPGGRPAHDFGAHTQDVYVATDASFASGVAGGASTVAGQLLSDGTPQSYVRVCVENTHCCACWSIDVCATTRQRIQSENGFQFGISTVIHCDSPETGNGYQGSPVLEETEAGNSAFVNGDRLPFLTAFNYGTVNIKRVAVIQPGDTKCFYIQPYIRFPDGAEDPGAESNVSYWATRYDFIAEPIPCVNFEDALAVPLAREAQ